MRRVLIVGCGGAGKSELSRRLGEITGLPVVHLDAMFWRPGWVMRKREEFDAELAEVLKGDSWIIDGNYMRTMPARLAAADTVIFLDMPRWLCLWRVTWRFLRHLGRTRPDMGPGCPEQLDAEFLEWIWKFPYETRLEVIGHLQAAGDCRTIILRSPDDVTGFMALVRREQSKGVVAQ